MTDQQIEEAARRFLEIIPHCRELGMSLASAGQAGIEFILPFNADLEANPGSGFMHSGAITTLLDSGCGMSSLTCLPEFEPCPTLDLRVDHLSLPEPGLSVHVFAEAYHVTHSVVFTRGFAFNRDRHQPFAQAVGTFMRLGKQAKGNIVYD